MTRFLLVLACILAVVIVAPAQVPNTFSYQGLLTTGAGTPLPDGMYKLKFELYTDSLFGILQWTETDTGIACVRGTFNVILGRTTAFPVIFNQALYLQVTALEGPTLGGPVTFSPRSELSSVPYALSLRLPYTGRAKTPPGTSAFTVYQDSLNAYAIYASGASPGASNSGIINGLTTGLDANAVFGRGYVGNGAWGVLGESDSGIGAAGYAFKRAGFGIGGYNNFHGGGVGVYSYGKLLVDSPPGGDTSVVLPPSSISSSEILDEPGISQGIITSSSVSVPTTGVLITIDSTTMTIPADGYVVVEAGGQANFFGTTGGNYISIQIDDVPGGGLDLDHYEYAGASAFESAGSHFMPVSTRHTFYKTKGTYTFWFRAANASASAGAARYIWNSVITAMYVPTSYGAVSTVIPPSATSAFSKSTIISPSGNSPQPASVSGSAIVDLRDLEVRALRAREDADRAMHEYLDARNAKAKALGDKPQLPDDQR